MSELVGRILENLYLEKPDMVLYEPQVLQTVLHELSPDEPRAIRLILLGLAHQVPHQLLETPAEEVLALLKTLSLNLKKQHHLHIRYSQWLVETWATALGLFPALLEPTNIFAEAEEEYRQALRASTLSGSLTDALKKQLQVLEEQLLLAPETAQRILKEVQEERQRQQENLKTVTSTLWAKPYVNQWGMAFVRIEPGSFMMGSPEYEYQREMDEALHRVQLTQAYMLQTTPVTQAQWQAVMGTNPSDFKGPELPVENVSWNDVVTKFLPRLNEQGQGVYRLPTEAEWEYAARAGSAQAFLQWGNASHLDEYAWYNNNSNFQTQPVAAKKPNAWGLYDMFGNVWEWCQDWYMAHPDFEVVDPQGPGRGPGRVMRGGSWFGDALTCRSAARGYMPPETRIRLIGVRLVREDDALLGGSS